MERCAEVDLPEVYKELYPEAQENREEYPSFILPKDLAGYKDKIIQDYLDGFYKADRKFKERLGIGAYHPRRVEVVELPLVYYGGKIGVIQGAYDPEEDTLYINPSFYTHSCYPPLIDLERGRIIRLPICYRLDGNPSGTYTHEIIHQILFKLGKDRFNQEIAVRKLMG